MSTQNRDAQNKLQRIVLLLTHYQFATRWKLIIKMAIVTPFQYHRKTGLLLQQKIDYRLNTGFTVVLTAMWTRTNRPKQETLINLYIVVLIMTIGNVCQIVFGVNDES
jgi:hypothetical protein